MGLYAAPRLLPAGDGAVSVELGDEISREANARALTLERLLLDARLPGLVDTVPTFRSLLVHYDPLVLPGRRSTRSSASCRAGWRTPTPPPGRRVELPCAYGGAHGPDLEEVARRLALTPAEVVALHAGAEHYVYFVGFTPGLPYMAGQPARLTIPRLDRPADQDSPGERRDRRNPDLHLLGGEPRRLLAARPDAAPPLRSPARPSRSCSAPATASASGRSSPPSTRRSRPRSRRALPPPHRGRRVSDAIRERTR